MFHGNLNWIRNFALVSWYTATRRGAERDNCRFWHISTVNEKNKWIVFGATPGSRKPAKQAKHLAFRRARNWRKRSTRGCCDIRSRMSSVYNIFSQRLHLLDTGELERLQNFWLTGACQDTAGERKTHSVPLGIENFISAFGLLAWMFSFVKKCFVVPGMFPGTCFN